MDLSGVIFVALAVAWAAYLIPKALKHHDEVVRSRSVDRFSHTMRVLARREPVTKRDARLVVSPSRAVSPSIVETKQVQGGHADPVAPRVRTAANRRATQRRRRVLGLLLLANAVVIGVAAFALIGWVWVAAPAGLVVAWLVACRLMVRRERAPMIPSAAEPLEATAEATPEVSLEVERNDQGFDELGPDSETSSVPVVPAGDPALWDPLPMNLPTYVNKPAAQRRSVRTISMEESGVWTSGRTDADAALAREADRADQAARASRTKSDGHRAVGS